MSTTAKQNAFVEPAAVAISVGQMFQVTATSNNPTYLVLTALDRDEYAAGASGATGNLAGNGHTLSLGRIGGDARGAGLVFAYQAATGRYYNSTYGYLDQLAYDSSGSAGDVTNLSLFATNSPGLATAYCSDATAMMQVDAAGYLGSATVVTQPGFMAAMPVQATPSAIAAAADSFVGQAWNMNGCWVLASTIAAEVGASLPVQSTAIGLAGQPNGEWIVAFNGPQGQSGNWQSMVTAGDMMVIATPGGGGHITTCVGGSGGTAMLVDNITYVNSNGQVQNAANDGSSSDVIIAAPHAAAQEWAGVQASSVVIYQLDTPIVSARVMSDSLFVLGAQSLAPLFTAIDPVGKAIVDWQVYDTAATDALVLNAADYQGHTAASALTVSALSTVSLLAGSAPTTDTLEVRAYNGSYWGDWTPLAVSILPAAFASVAMPAPPALTAQTAAQIWQGGKTVALALSASTFTDPQGQPLTYNASLSNGQPLPSWLTFNTATRTFSGTAPAAAQTLGIAVNAVDSGGLSASETFTATILPPTPAIRPAITVSAQTPNQLWSDGQAANLQLPADTFTDALGLKMTFVAYEMSGPNVTTWLHFNPTTADLSGMVPTRQSGTVQIAVIAADTLHVTATDLFSVSFAPAGGHATSSLQISLRGVLPPTNAAHGPGMLALHG